MVAAHLEKAEGCEKIYWHICIEAEVLGTDTAVSTDSACCSEGERRALGKTPASAQGRADRQSRLPQEGLLGGSASAAVQ